MAAVEGGEPAVQLLAEEGAAQQPMAEALPEPARARLQPREAELQVQELVQARPRPAAQGLALERAQEPARAPSPG